MALKAQVHKTTYGPLIDTAPCVMFWMRADSLRGQMGGGWALEMALASSRSASAITLRVHTTIPTCAYTYVSQR